MVIVNFFAGPGTGKSAHAEMLSARLKTKHINTELIQEYAKDKTWTKDSKTLEIQPYIAGKQFYRQARLRNSVDIAVTDSPILLGIAYDGFGITENFTKWQVEAFKMFDNINILLKRDPNAEFNANGRWQNLEEAKEKDRRISQILLDNKIHAYEVQVRGDESHDEVLNIVLEELKFRRPEIFKKLQ